MPGIKQALIIAAGNGSRLQPRNGMLPKPLTPVCGVPLLKRTLKTIQQAGIESCCVVLGFQGEAIRQALERDPEIQMAIQWIHNEDWKKSNGVSVLKAKQVLKEEFLLLMADHLFQAQSLARLLRRRPAPGEVILAVDRKIDQVYDIDDATKVKLNGTLILDIGKNLEDYNAIDTGMFLCGPELFTALEEAYQQRGDCSLSDGVRGLIPRGRFRFFDIQEGWWQDVDTPGALNHVENVFIQNLKKLHPNALSRLVFWPLSIRLTKRLINSSYTSSQVAVLGAGLGLVAGILFSFGRYWPGLLAAAVFFLSEVLFSASKKMTKLKMEEVKKSEMFRMLCGNLGFMAVLGGIVLGTFTLEKSAYVLMVGLITGIDMGFLQWLRFQDAKRLPGGFETMDQLLMLRQKSNSVAPTLVQESERAGERVLFPEGLVAFLTAGEMVAALTFLLALVGFEIGIFWLLFVVTHLGCLAVLYQQTRIIQSPAFSPMPH